jgi:hypothetical protein
VRVLEKCISVSGRRFKSGSRGKRRRAWGQRKLHLLPSILYCTVLIAFSINTYCTAELLDRIVAVVNREIILYSELQRAVEKSKAAGENKTDIEVLQGLIDRTLLLEQAQKFQVELKTYNRTDEEARKMIDDYINRRIKAFIHVPFEEVENYYASHKDDFGGRGLYEVWDKIEERLKIGLLAIKLDEHISQLRKEAYIRIQLEE